MLITGSPPDAPTGVAWGGGGRPVADGKLVIVGAGGAGGETVGGVAGDPTRIDAAGASAGGTVS
ncbi:MAG: hypothetical protein KC766_23810, partial [Myxococcales bacterium]|nr:hypothetical protein [Myxococcales bacterium]